MKKLKWEDVFVCVLTVTLFTYCLVQLGMVR